MKAITTFFTLSLLAFATSGCSVNPATGEQSFTGLMSEQQELKVGKQEHPKILKQFGGAYDHQAVTQYVDDLGQRLAKVSELPTLKWTFTVLDDPIINAFALPGGYIYISRGLINLAESEAELAAVLGHEIGHVTARHTAQRYSNSVLAGVGSTILGIVVGGPAGDLANFASQAALASYGRGHEMEADKLGIRYMTKLGYDPKAASTFFKKLAAHTELTARMKGEKGQQGHYSIFASHPDTQKRVEATTQLAKNYPPNINQTNRQVFLSLLDGVEYGTSVKQGITDGRTFIHPDLRMEFTVPEEFTIVNKPTYVAATHKNGSAMVFGMGRKDHGRLPMTRYLSEIWANKYNLRDLQPLEINRLEAATGTTRIKNKKGQIRDVRFLSIADGDDIFRFQFITPTNLTKQMELPFRHATYSFRRLSYREAKAVRGFQIGLHRVGRGDTISSLSSRMKVEKFKEDWFRVLNQETLKDGLQIGETVKLVVR